LLQIADHHHRSAIHIKSTVLDKLFQDTQSIYKVLPQGSVLKNNFPEKRLLSKILLTANHRVYILIKNHCKLRHVCM